MQVTFLRQYTSPGGNVFRRYAATDGSLVEVRVRTGQDGFLEYTNVEAKEEALRRLQAPSTR